MAAESLSDGMIRLKGEVEVSFFARTPHEPATPGGENECRAPDAEDVY